MSGYIVATMSGSFPYPIFDSLEEAERLVEQEIKKGPGLLTIMRVDSLIARGFNPEGKEFTLLFDEGLRVEYAELNFAHAEQNRIAPTCG